MGVDLKAPGLTAFFSWPSRGETQDYAVDEAAIESSEAAITEFLVRFASDVGAQRVHIIAHSMGNRALLRAMQRIRADATRYSSVQFGQIFLAAPDVDAGLFRELAAAYPQLTLRTTLYVSPADKAVGISRLLHGAARVGFTPPVTMVPGIDTVVIPDFNLDLLGHTYYAKGAGVRSDMFTLLRRDTSPADRQRLQAAAGDDGASYWTMLA
jgi:esterase/lipase superfamily enzyme